MDAFDRMLREVAEKAGCCATPVPDVAVVDGRLVIVCRYCDLVLRDVQPARS